MQSAVLARDSVRPSVCPTRSGIVSRVQTNEDTIVRFSASGRTIRDPSSFWRGKVHPDIRRGSPPAGALK